MNGIHTQWFDKVDRNCPLQEHPTPQFMRDEWLCLNGFYDYVITEITDELPCKYDGQIVVPFAVECELSGVNKSIDENHLLWYRRNITLPETYAGKKVLLHFGAVDYISEIFINGKNVFRHVGGYNPFKIEISDYISGLDFELIVKVWDPTDKGHQQRGKQVQKPFGFWYTATSGIWQTVWCEPVCENRIESVKFTPDIDSSSVNVKSSVLGEGRLFCTVFSGNEPVFSGEISNDENIIIPEPELWCPENPFLYSAELKLVNEDECDCIRSYFGMRKFSIVRDDNNILRLGLNNKPYFQKGLLDQGYWPESQLTAPCDEAMIFDISKMKELGFNMLRKHIKTEPARWYYHCDRLGMLVWQDMVSGGKALNLLLAGGLPNLNIHVKDNAYKLFNRDKEEWRTEFRNELFEMIDNLYNCVSICTWVPFNEGWGQFDAKQIGEAVKQFDRTRFVDHASGWHDQGGPDFKSIHKYVFPVHAPTKFRTGNRVVVLSEYGGYQNRVEGACWSDEPSFGLYLKFENKDILTENYEKLHYKQVIPLIEKGLSATVYTQVSDVECELNGMYTYDRKHLKFHGSAVKKINETMTF